MPTDLLSALTVLCLFAPPPCSLEDADKFPPPAVCDAMEGFYRMRLCWLDSHRPLETWHADEWAAERLAAQWHYDVWDWCGAARGCEGRDETYWLYSLRRLRLLIGDEAYFAGVMPD